MNWPENQKSACIFIKYFLFTPPGGFRGKGSVFQAQKNKPAGEINILVICHDRLGELRMTKRLVEINHQQLDAEKKMVFLHPCLPQAGLQLKTGRNNCPDGGIGRRVGLKNQ